MTVILGFYDSTCQSGDFVQMSDISYRADKRTCKKHYCFYFTSPFQNKNQSIRAYDCKL